MRILLDSDVVFDFLLERQPFFQAARELTLRNANGEFEGYISSITPVNLFYHGRKIEGAVQHASAAENDPAAIVTRNLKDYKNSTLPIFSPTDFLAKLKSEQK